MKSKPSKNRAASPDSNQGEGDKLSAQRFNDMQKSFVESPKGKDAIDHADQLSPKALQEAEAAERAGRSRAHGEDPAVTRDPTPSRSSNAQD